MVSTIAEPSSRPWSGHIRRGKLRRPDLPASALPRPRMRDRIDDGNLPCTLLIAPAGFGKTVAAAEWASLAPGAGWLTADPGDASLLRFWAHLREALAGESPHCGDLVQAALAAPHRPASIDLGRLLADELLDTFAPLRLVVDDLHVIAPGDVFDFLTGLLEMPPPNLRLVITARVEPPLPLPRMRIRGTVNEIHAAELLFTEAEVRSLVTVAAPGEPAGSGERVQELWRRTGGWAAGLRIAHLAGAAPNPPAKTTSAAQLDSRLLSLLIEEMLAELHTAQRRVLLRAALPERFNPHLLTALGDDVEVVAETIGYARSAALCHPSALSDGDWLEFHPLFREALRQQLLAETAPAAIAQVHRRAADWFGAAGMTSASIVHWLGAGELDTVAALVERQLHLALAREDWPSIARYLDHLPDDLIQNRPQLLLGRAWLAHVRGRYGLKSEIVRAVDQRLAAGDLAPAVTAALRAELDVLKLDNITAVQNNPAEALATAQRALESLTEDRRFPIGVAWVMLAAALQSQGQRKEAEATLRRLFERATDWVDAVSIRGLLGLCLLYVQEGELANVEAHAQTMAELAAGNGLRLSEGWGRALVGDALYERNEIERSIAHNALVARDYEFCHLLCILEAHFTLAQAYLAAGRVTDARRTRRRTREILIAANAVEQLSVFNAYDAYLSLLMEDIDSAVSWASSNRPSIDGASLHSMHNPAAIRAAILCAVGGETNLQEAHGVLTALRERAMQQRFVRPLVRIEAMSAIVQLKQGARASAFEAMRRSLDIGLPRGFVRAYLDLARVFPAEVLELFREIDVPVALRTELEKQRRGIQAMRRSSDRFDPAAMLTVREHEILAALDRRLTYDEIAEQFFISPHTVKRHASNIYGKLGVSSRVAALKSVRAMGWRPDSAIS